MVSGDDVSVEQDICGGRGRWCMGTLWQGCGNPLGDVVDTNEVYKNKESK